MSAPIETESFKYNQLYCVHAQMLFSKNEYYLPERNVTFLCCVIFQENKENLYYVREKDGGFESKDITRELRIPKALASKIAEYIQNKSVFEKESEDMAQKLCIAFNKQLEELSKLGIKDLTEEDKENLALKELGQEKLNALNKRDAELKQATLSIGKEFIEFANQNGIDTFL